MNNRLLITLLGILSLLDTLKAQEIVWTGNNDNDFFNELNWKITGTTSSPVSGTIDPGKTINYKVLIDNNSGDIIADGTILPGSEGLLIRNSNLLGQAIENGTLTIDVGAYVSLESNSPLNGSAIVNFDINAGWLKLPKVKPEAVLNNLLYNIKLNGQSASYKNNLRIDNYYANGTLLRPENNEITPLTVYQEANFEGVSAQLKINITHSGSSISNGLNNAISSFVLKRGYMAVMADNIDGTGLSKVFIASEKDLALNELPANLKDLVSFIRIIPWNWVSKKGLGGNKDGLNETWFYRWGTNDFSTIRKEFAPLAWGKNGADDDDDIELYKSKYKATHVMAFNESDNCNDQSGKWGDLCQTDVAVATYKNLMKTGLRLVSPSCRENAPFGWLKEVYDKTTAQNIRIDVIGVHWYDWGSNPKNSPDADPQQVFNRFKNYLQRVYDLYQLPIWITEFNANPNRTTATNKSFMELALPYLDQLDYVERYAWFEPNSDVADYYESDGTTYTDVGIFYRDHQSTPSVPEDYLQSPSNLDRKMSEDSDFFDDFESYEHGANLSGIYTVWEGTANAVDFTQNTEYGYPYEGDKFGKSDDSKTGFYLRKTFSLEAGKTYIWELSTRMTDGLKHVMSVLPDDVYPNLQCYNSEWEKHSIEFTVQEGSEEVTLTLYRWPLNTIYFDNFHLMEKGTSTSIYDLNYKEEDLHRVIPNPSCDNIMITSMDAGTTLKFYSLQGACVYESVYSNNMDISFLKSGMYFIRTQNTAIKFIKQ